MVDSFIETTAFNFNLMMVPKKSKWKCQLFGDNTIIYIPNEGKVPNWFWRKMQYLCFGMVWIKLE